MSVQQRAMKIITEKSKRNENPQGPFNIAK